MGEAGNARQECHVYMYKVIPNVRISPINYSSHSDCNRPVNVDGAKEKCQSVWLMIFEAHRVYNWWFVIYGDASLPVCTMLTKGTHTCNILYFDNASNIQGINSAYSIVYPCYKLDDQYDNLHITVELIGARLKIFVQFAE